MAALPATLEVSESNLLLLKGEKGDKGDQGAPGSGSLPYVADLKAFLDARHGAGGWTGRTGVGQGTDIGPALTDALTFLRANYGRGTVSIPPGTFLMTTPPSAALLSGQRVVGQGSMASSIVYNKGDGVALYFSGAAGYSGGGMSGIAVLLEEGFPTSTSYAVCLQGDATYQPDQTMFSDLYINALGNSYWYDGFRAYGGLRTSPQGIRVSDLNNIQVFRCRNTGFYLDNIVQFSGRNLGVYAGQGTGNNFWITGGANANQKSTNCQFDLVAATLSVGNVANVKINGTTYG